MGHGVPRHCHSRPGLSGDISPDAADGARRRSLRAGILGRVLSFGSRRYPRSAFDLFGGGRRSRARPFALLATVSVDEALGLLVSCGPGALQQLAERGTDRLARDLAATTPLPPG